MVRRILFYTTAATGTFYVGSVFIAFNNQRYYDFFNDSVPLVQPVIDFAERHDWDEFTVDTLVHTGIGAVASVSEFISRLRSSQPDGTRTDAADQHPTRKDRLKAVTDALKTKVEKSETNVLEGGRKAMAVARHQAAQFAQEVDQLIREAEGALTTTPTATEVVPTNSVPTLDDGKPDTITEAPPPYRFLDQKVYDGVLPIGHELPYGFSRSTPPAPAPQPNTNTASQPLPLVAPSLAGHEISEPVIAQLASTIDNLASYVNSNPAAAQQAKDVLEKAKLDLTGLASRIETLKSEKIEQLESTLEEQTRDYTIKMLELEMEAQDKLDSQEEGFRKFFDEERAKFAQAYREKLDQELRTQTELINER